MINMKKLFLINSLVASCSLVISLFIVEFILLILNYKPLLSKSPKKVSYNQEICKVDSLDQARKENIIYGPLGNQFIKHNEYGYTLKGGFSEFDKVDFNYQPLKKVLVLGDSFTWGASAEKGRGFIDLTSKHFKSNRIAFYNTAIAGYGQNNQLAILKNGLKEINLDLVILGFYTGNDFTDNLTPVDRFFSTNKGWYSRYTASIIGGKLFTNKRSEEEILQLIRLSECYNIDIKKSVKTYLYKSRLGSIIFLAIRKVRFSPNNTNTNSISDRDIHYSITRDYLIKIRDLCNKAGVPLRIVVIPDYSNSTPRTFRPSKNYIKLIALLKELKIDYFDPFSTLNYFDYAGAFDDHWSNSGHKKMSEILIKGLDKLLID